MTAPTPPGPASGNLYASLRAHFPAALDDVAIETVDTPEPLRYTWRDLELGSARIANLLADLGLEPGARVVVHADKSVESAMLYLATLRAGLIHVPLNPAYQAGELGHFLEDAAPALVVCAPRHFTWVSRLAFARGVRTVLTLGDDRGGSLLARAAQMGDRFETAARAASDTAVIVYTSGTTGRSKGAQLTHGNLAANMEALHEAWAWRDGRADGERAGRDTLVHALPIFHVHGLFVALHGALRAGARMRWFHRFNPAAAVAALPGASVFMGVPTMYVRMLAQPALARASCESIRLFVSGSAPLLAATFEDWRACTGHAILERYGMSETVMLASNPYRPESARRAGTVGRALPGVGVRVRGGDGRDCAPGEIGGVEVRGPSVFAGYWRMPEKTREEFTDDGWFRTGDVGSLDAGGTLTLAGRSKDLVISGGFNVYPAEVEERIDALDGVAESAVVGVPHPDFGEAVVAVVVPRPGAVLEPAAIVAALRGAIAGFKVPKHVRVVDELPRNAMGKVQKKALRDELAGLFA
jgi:malonyl-CoA/methylmalonyl-CoA synthetase